jgi:hypothetical protein
MGAVGVQGAESAAPLLSVVWWDLVIVGLNVALKGPFPLVGESELARESEMARAIWCDFTPIFFCEEHQKLTHDFLASVAPTTFLVIIDFYLRSKNSSS